MCRVFSGNVLQCKIRPIQDRVILVSNDTIFGLFGHYVAFGTALLTFLNGPSLCVGLKLRHNLGA